MIGLLIWLERLIMLTIITNLEKIKMAKTTAKDKKHYAKVAALGCIACKKLGFDTPNVEIHHIGNGTMAKRGNNREVIPLCFEHHRGGNIGTAVHAGRKSFEYNFGTEQDLLREVLSCL